MRTPRVRPRTPRVAARLGSVSRCRGAAWPGWACSAHLARLVTVLHFIRRGGHARRTEWNACTVRSGALVRGAVRSGGVLALRRGPVWSAWSYICSSQKAFSAADSPRGGSAVFSPARPAPPRGPRRQPSRTFFSASETCEWLTHMAAQDAPRRAFQSSHSLAHSSHARSTAQPAQPLPREPRPRRW